MSITLTARDNSYGSGAETQNRVSEAYVPAASSLLFAANWAQTASGTIDLTISANTGGLEFTPQAQSAATTGGGKVAVSTAPVGGSPASMTSTCDAGASTQTGYIATAVFDAVGTVDVVRIRSVAGVPQIITSSEAEGGGDTETIVSGTLGATTLSSSTVVLIVGCNNDATGIGTAQAGWSTLSTQNGSFEKVEVFYHTGVTITSVTSGDLGQSISAAGTILLELEEGSFTSEQEAYRVRNDDGSETTATWVADENTAADVELDTVYRLRAAVTVADGDATAIAWDLEYTEDGATDWRKIGVGLPGTTPAVVGYGAAANAGTNDPGATLDQGSWTPAENDVVVLFATSTTVLDLVVDGSLPAGWFGVLGSGVEVNSDAHGYCAAWHKVTAAEALAGTTAYALTNGLAANETGNVIGVAVRGCDPAAPIHKAQASFNSDNTGTPDTLSALSGANQPTITGCLVLSGICQDSTGSYSTPGTHTSITSDNNSTIHQVFQRTANTTAGADVAAVSITPDGGDEDCAITIAFGPPIGTASITTASSTNFADGDATTGQLTGTGTFDAGVMVEATATSDAVTITDGHHTELEWAFLVQDPAVADDVFDFRVTAAGVPLSTYSVTPTVTVGGGGDATATPAAIALAATVPAVTTQAGAVKSPAVTALAATMPAATGSNSKTILPAVTALTAALPAATPLTGSVKSPAVIPLATTIPAATGVGGSAGIASPAVTPLALTVPAATPAAGTVTSPAVIARTVVVPAVTPLAGSVTSPAVIARTVTVPAVTATGGSAGMASPAVIARSVVVPAVTAGGHATATPAVIPLTVTIAVAISVGSTIGVDVTPLTVTMPAATGTGGGSMTATPTVIPLTVTMPATTGSGAGNATPVVTPLTVTIPAATGSGASQGTATPASITTLVTMPAVTKVAGYTVAPAATVLAVTMPSAVASGSRTVTPTVIPLSVTVPAATGSGGSSGTATPNAVALVTVIPSPTLTFGYVVNPAVIVLAISIGAAIAQGLQPDAYPITVTMRDEGHTVTVRVTGTTATIYDTGHTATVRE